MTNPNRRVAPRHPCPQATVLQVLPRAAFGALKARVKDVSSSGIALLCDEPVEIGMRLAVQWHFGEPTDHRNLMARVVRLVPQDDGVLVGCQFETPLSDAEVQALLAHSAGRPVGRGRRGLGLAVDLIARLCGIG